MKLGVMVGYSGRKMGGPIANMTATEKTGFADNSGLPLAKIQECESLGYDSVWTAEAWGSDAATPLAWIGAHTQRIKLGTSIMQIPGRTPANTAMTAMTLDAMSGGRFLLGLGLSGPQVAEGWHGQPYNKTLTWATESIEVVRKAIKREEKLSYDGKRLQLPYRGPGSTGQGKALKSILHGNPDIPIYYGGLSPKAQQMAGRICDGLLLTSFNPDRPDYVEGNLRGGFADSTRHSDFTTFDVAATCAVIVADDLDQARLPLKQQLGFYIGGMGSKKTNFYRDFLSRSGFEADCAKVSALWFEGDRKGAIMAVPDAMIDAIYLVGSKDRIRDRFQAWKESCIGTLIVGSLDLETLRFVAELNAG